MSRRRRSTDTTPFDTLRLEGSLFVPELLERAAGGEATFQKETDYAIPKGLKLHDEYGRAFRIATATWQSFAPQTARADLDAATITRAFVVDFLRQCLGYTDLAPLGSPIQLGDRGFPVTAQALGARLPVIIAPHHLGLDDPDPRFAIIGSGSRKKSAHQLAQEFLNASPDSLWAIVTNGRTLRLLRDADTLTRPNFLEFDLETILRDDQHRYADFSALWRILHYSRAVSPDSPATCIWEQWKSEGHAQGLRVRDGLRDGVQEALLILGRGFLTQPDNIALRQRLHGGTLTTDAYFQQLLRLIYRSLFLFCAEERDLLHAPDSTPAARQAYATGYSLRRFRFRALRQSAHDPHGDLWQSLRIVFRGLSGGQPRLALPALGGLFAETQCPDLDSATISNRDLLSAMRELRWFFDKKTGKRSAIDYRNMGPEELGSVYESLLELVPTLDLPGRVFGFAGITDTASSSGNARKTSGSYYTPDSLVQELIKSALDPVITQKLADHPANPIDALLSITVCDPSCGSGHFLLAAARRLAEKLAELRAPDGAVRPDDYRHALREVASRCLYGVDINPMAVELCRVALWLETVDPGKPLGFLNHHIRSGNSLLGTTPDLIAAGLPDETFTAIEGDDKPACAELKKRNKAERTGFGPLFAKEEDSIREKLRQTATAIESMDDSQPDALQKKEAAFLTNEIAPEYRHAKLLADLWCAAFVIKKSSPPAPDDSQISNLEAQIPASVEGQLLHSDDDLFGQPVPAAKPTAKPTSHPKTEKFKLGTASGITTGTLRDFVQGKPLPPWLEDEIRALASQHRFFHWHLAFPQIFDQGGFNCILGNPPWERLKFEDKKWFAERAPEIAASPSALARAKKSSELSSERPELASEYIKALRHAAAESHFVCSSGRFFLVGGGDVNTYAVFTEAAISNIAPRGRVGMIVPSAISSTLAYQPYFSGLVESGKLISFFDFENKKSFFPDVHSSYRFCLLTVSGSRHGAVSCGFLLHSLEDLRREERTFQLRDSDLLLLSPNTRAFPVFQSQKDASVVRHIYSSIPILWNDQALTNPWDVSIYRMIDATESENIIRDDGDFKRSEAIIDADWSITEDSTVWLRVYEGKMIDSFNHRLASSFTEAGGQRSGKSSLSLPNELENPTFSVRSRYWVKQSTVNEKLRTWQRKWLIAFMDVCSATNSRTMIPAIIPLGGATKSLRLITRTKQPSGIVAALSANFGSFVFDYVTRQSVSGLHLSEHIVKQLPVLPPVTYAQPCPWVSHPQSPHDLQSLRDWLLPRVLELTYTAWDLEPFAQDCDWPGPPFRWDEDRRFMLRSELDAAFFHLYLGTAEEWQQQPETLTRAFPTPRHAVSYIMDTFPIVKRKDEAKHGSFHTKDTILHVYDALAESIQTGVAYQDRLSVPPADILATHDPRWPVGVRPNLAPNNYFLYVIPLLMRFQAKGIERKRLLHALEILTDKSLRKSSASSTEFGIKWADSLSKTTYSSSDATRVLLAWLQAGNLHGTQRIHLDPAAPIPIMDPWLEMDAFMALKLAMAASLQQVQATETKQQTTIDEITRISA